MSSELYFRVLVLIEFVIIVMLCWNVAKLWDAVNDVLRCQLQQLAALTLKELEEVEFTDEADQSST